MSRLSVAAAVVLMLLSLGAPWIALHAPEQQFRDSILAPPGNAFLLGTDEYGRDIFSRLLHAGRWSILAGSLATLLALTLGTVLGLAAASGVRAIDAAVLWLADVSQGIPWLYLLFAIRGALPLAVPEETVFLAILAIVGLAGWPVPARLVRASSLGILSMDYARASLSFGASRWRVLRVHALPALGPVLAPQVFVLMPQFVLAESALSFLGLGLSEPTPTWGSMLAAARQSMPAGLHWPLLSPLIPLSILSVASARLAERTLASR